jgi:hypothetical protein
MKTLRVHGQLLSFAAFDGMSWPLPTERLGHLLTNIAHVGSSEDRAVAVACLSVLSAYEQMIADPEPKRRVVLRELRALRKAQNEQPLASSSPGSGR